MTFLFGLECAVWHPTASVQSIENAVGMSSVAGGSAGTSNHITGRSRDRTYCRFDLGAFAQEEFSEGLSMLRPFERLADLPEFSDGKGSVTVYFRDNKDAPELYLNTSAIETLCRLNASVVFW